MVVTAAGDPDPALVADALGGRRPSRVVAADSGAEVAHDLGWHVDLVVGDLDSVGADALARVEAEGGRVERHPPAKDETDLDLALRAAGAQAPAGEVLVVGGGAGRLDHLLGVLLLLGHEAHAGLRLDAVLGGVRVTVVRADRRRLHGRPGDLVSLFALHGPARGVTTEALLYPLSAATLEPGSTRGVSNELVAEEASVVVAEGVVLAVQPGEPGEHLFAGRPPAAG